MARTPSAMVPIGTKAPMFDLPDTATGKNISLQDIQGQKGTLILFICNHCPFVKHVNKELVRLVNDYNKKGIGFAAISSNDVISYPEDSPEMMKQVAEDLHYPFPYLYDESQEVARAYQAVCTPDFFLYDRDLTLIYQGQLDDSRPGNGIPVTGIDIREALDCLLAGLPLAMEQRPSIGCSIKWKAPFI